MFSGDRGSGADIYTINADGSGLRRLTHVKGDAGSPDWSPDSTRIVFGIEDKAVYLMDADGGDLHQVTAPGGEPAFTPDGDHLVLLVRRMRGRGRRLPDPRRWLRCPRREADDEPIP